jgi:hypothetical protein
MSVFIANFGRENYAWPECLRRSTIATMNEVGAQRFWLNSDREGYIEYRQKHSKTARGEVPIKPVASRWFNLMSIVSQSEGDYWIHRDGDNLWWTKSGYGEPTYEELIEPIEQNRHVVMCHKECEPWSNKDEQGRNLFWNSLHPKARDFLSTESTLQKLSPEYESYALALIQGEPLDKWHETKKWKVKRDQSSSKAGDVYVFSDWDRAIYRIAQTAFNTTSTADGRMTESISKIKNMGFSSQSELEEYLKNLAVDQDFHCALTGLQLNRFDDVDDSEMNVSLDRIDSNGHYEPGNIQLVCKFANRWKGADDNSEFIALLDRIRLA